jgi:4-diphosphocytidyl-2-C-methyl-D-erythritol kinase
VTAITLAAPAKVNLALRVGPLRKSGFHDVDTVLCTLALADTVMVRETPEAPGIRLAARADAPLEALPDMGPDADNLAVRAAAAFHERASLKPALEIELIKRIPAGGGLGGGSSDAGAVLRALRRLHPAALDAPAVQDVARELGSDVPFLASGLALAHGTGRGDRIEPLPALPSRPVVAVIPALSVSTASAYGWLDEDRAGDEVGDEVGDGLPVPSSWEDAAAGATNDFEAPVFARHPELGEIRDALREHGAAVALLAGSGASVFGVYPGDEAARAAAAALRQAWPGAATVVTRTR